MIDPSTRVVTLRRVRPLYPGRSLRSVAAPDEKDTHQVLSPAVLFTVLGLVFVAELPDKTAIASLVLGTKFKASWVFAGAAAAFVIHVVIAVAAGSVLSLLPRRPLEAVVAALFLLGAFLLWREASGDEDEDESEGSNLADNATFWKVSGTSFGIIFLAEFGDLTQILTANLAARYHDPISVGIGAVLALWAVALLGILGGKALLRVIPIGVLARVGAFAMLVLAGFSVYNAIKG